MRPTFPQVLIGIVGSLVGTVLATFFLLGQIPALLEYGPYPVAGAALVLLIVLVGRVLEGIEASTAD